MSSVIPCPPESDFAELAAGTLSDSARRALEEHLDSCQACTELVGVLGALPLVLEPQVTLASSGGTSTCQRAVPWWLTDHAAVASTMLATQCFWSAVLWVPAIQWLRVADPSTRPVVLWAFAVYASCVGLLGPLLAVAALVAARRRSQWVQLFILVHAMVAVPSVVMAPLAIVALARVRRQARPRTRIER